MQLNESPITNSEFEVAEMIDAVRAINLGCGFGFNAQQVWQSRAAIDEEISHVLEEIAGMSCEAHSRGTRDLAVKLNTLSILRETRRVLMVTYIGMTEKRE